MQGGVATEPDRKTPWMQALKHASVGIEMAVCIVLGWAIGSWLDARFETAPWLMLVFLLFGVAAGFKALIREARKMSRGTDRTDGESKG
jgi:ATP synthase protein I